MIECEPVGAVAVLTEHGDLALLPFHDAIRRHVAEQQIAAAAENRALRERQSRRRSFPELISACILRSRSVRVV